MKRLNYLARKNFGKFQIGDVNPKLIRAEYAVRGRVPQRAQEIASILQRQKNGEKGLPQYPFETLTEANIGNPQTFGQPPISFNRQVLSGILNPELVKNGGITNKDVIDRIAKYNSSIIGNVGAYTLSHGYGFARESVVDFIARRDNATQKTDINNIIMTNGASEGVNNVLLSLITGKKDGIMIPIPQYPLYSALIELYGGSQVNYYLDENQKWASNVEKLKQSHQQAVSQGINPKVLCVINPGNPTGTILSKQNMEEIVKFACKKNLLILADEVYQENIYTNDKFYSFKEILDSLPAPYNKTQLVSVHSTSKGLMGECGLRGGYMECVNLDPEVYAQMVKFKSINLCSNAPGQLLTECMVNHPRENAGFRDETIEQYHKEKEEIFQGLKQRSQLLTEKLNKMTNIESQPAEAAMYAFPRIHFSNKVLEKAREQSMQPDLYYCLQVLENTGMVLVPGSGFGQEDGTYHFRITNLIRPVELFEEKFEIFAKFNEQFHNDHKDLSNKKNFVNYRQNSKSQSTF